MLETAGNIQFERAPGGRGTPVRVALEYSPPSGRVGGAIAAIFPYSLFDIPTYKDP